MSFSSIPLHNSPASLVALRSLFSFQKMRKWSTKRLTCPQPQGSSSAGISLCNLERENRFMHSNGPLSESQAFNRCSVSSRESNNLILFNLKSPGSTSTSIICTNAWVHPKESPLKWYQETGHPACSMLGDSTSWTMKAPLIFLSQKSSEFAAQNFRARRSLRQDIRWRIDICIEGGACQGLGTLRRDGDELPKSRRAVGWEGGCLSPQS